MKYDMKVTQNGNYGSLEFKKKDGKTEDIYLGFIREGSLADRCLETLYDYHQCNDEFGETDEMEVAGVGTFAVHGKIHVIPADEATNFAVMGVTRENPFRVSYSGIDGNSSTMFPTLKAAAEYVKARWQGIDYADGPFGFHTDYGKYVCFGFELKDIGTYSGTTREDRNFEFKEVE